MKKSLSKLCPKPVLHPDIGRGVGARWRPVCSAFLQWTAMMLLIRQGLRKGKNVSQVDVLATHLSMRRPEAVGAKIH